MFRPEGISVAERFVESDFRPRARINSEAAGDPFEGARHLGIVIGEVKVNWRAGAPGIEVLGIDQGHGAGAIVDARHEAAEGLEADHTRLVDSIDVGERVQGQDQEHLIGDAGLRHPELGDLGEPNVHHPFAGAMDVQPSLGTKADRLGRGWGDQVHAAGVE